MRNAFPVFILLIVFVSCKKKDNETTPQPLPAPVVTRHVTYRIGCTDCEVIYYGPNGSSLTEYHKDSNWSYAFDGKKGDVVLLLAYNTSSVAQGVTACIKLNNDTLAIQTNYCPISGDSFVTDTLK